MGGRGSGTRYRGSKQTTIEEVCKIDIRYLKKHGWLDGLAVGTLSWNCDGEPSGSIGVKTLGDRMVLNYRNRSYDDDWESIEQTVHFDKTPCNFGGHRYWFICPQCATRVAILCAGGSLFLCRHCYRLPYASQTETYHDRILRKQRKIEDRICEDGDFSIKKKRLHWTTFDRLYAEYQRLDNAYVGIIGRRFGLFC